MIKFEDLQNGGHVHVIEFDIKSGQPKYICGIITDIGEKVSRNPHSQLTPSPVPALASMLGQQPDKDKDEEKIFNLRIELNGEEKEFQKVSTSSDYFSIGRFKVSTDKEKIFKEIKALREENQTYLNNVEKYKAMVEACDSALQDIGYVDLSSNSSAEIKELKSNMANLELKLSSLGGEVSSISSMLKEFLAETKESAKKEK